MYYVVSGVKGAMTELTYYFLLIIIWEDYAVTSVRNVKPLVPAAFVV
jgi:hypothetical protein